MRAFRALHREIWGKTAYDETYAAQAPRSSTRDRHAWPGSEPSRWEACSSCSAWFLPPRNATQPNPEHKVTLCHATDSYSHPYVRITVDVASVLHHGHDGHTGPVFYAAIPKHTKWGDVIPPFDFGPGEKYAGKNWTAVGIALFNNGCAGPSSPTTTTPSTAPPSTAPPTTAPPTTAPQTTSSARRLRRFPSGRRRPRHRRRRTPRA